MARATLRVCFALALWMAQNAATQVLAPSPSVAVSPAKVNLRAGGTRKFFVRVSEGLDPKIAWRVNGVKGGNTTTGTISADGTFTAPEIPPANNVVEIEAVSGSVIGKADVTLLNPTPLITSLD